MQEGKSKAANSRVYRTLARKTFTSGQLPLHVRRHCLNEAVAPHDHDFMEIALIFSGRGLHSTLYGVEELRPGDVFLLRPGAWHHYRQCHDLGVYNCCFGLDLWRRELICLHRNPVLHHLFWAGPHALLRRGLLQWHLSEPALKRCVAQLDAMARSDQSHSIDAPIEEIGHLLLLLAELARHIEAEQPGLGKHPHAPHPLVEEAVRLLEAHYSQDWTLNELSNRLHLDRSYLVRRFKESMGLAPMAFLARCRLERAAALLLRTQYSVTEITEAVGFSDPNYFARRFKAHFGVSASAYREQAVAGGVEVRPLPGAGHGTGTGKLARGRLLRMTGTIK